MIFYEAGSPVHAFYMEDLTFHVVRGNSLLVGYVANDHFAAVVTPQRISYHQAALWAQKQIKTGNVHPAEWWEARK